MPHQTICGLTCGIENNELIASGEFVFPPLVASNPTWNQSRLQVVDHGSRGFVDVEGSEVCIEAGEHFTHILGGRRCYRRCRTSIGHAANRPAAGVHQLREYAPGLVIYKTAYRVLAPRISHFTPDFVRGRAAHQLPHADEFLAFPRRT